MSRSDSISLEVSELSKSFGADAAVIDVLGTVSLTMKAGQSLAITGPSGSGKSTLLHLIGTLDRPSAGQVRINGQDPFGLPEPKLAFFRNQKIGFVFQDHHLLPQYTVLENALLPTLAFKGKDQGARERALELLTGVGLAQRLDHFPAQLSGGERQRVAVARALINSPDLLLCDEPTGNLDQATADEVAALLFELHRARRNILIAVTHSLDLAARFERRFELREGACVEV
jgi:lipoprotein-releasing system ATP-binding protein